MDSVLWSILALPELNGLARKAFQLPFSITVSVLNLFYAEPSFSQAELGIGNSVPGHGTRLYFQIEWNTDALHRDRVCCRYRFTVFADALSGSRSRLDVPRRARI